MRPLVSFEEYLRIEGDSLMKHCTLAIADVYLNPLED
jgi:hypothetical protein